MRILLTNDDGYDAPGLLALAEAVSGLPDVEIDVVAPAEPQSGIGHAVSGSLAYDLRELDGFGSLVAVHGRPADCVRAALCLPGRSRPDWVISGINRGGNLGVDLFSSGTVAAAREAAIHSIPAIAISQLVRAGEPDDWTRAGREARSVLAGLLTQSCPKAVDLDHWLDDQTRSVASSCLEQLQNAERFFWNVNLPKHPPDRPTEQVKLTGVSSDPIVLEFDHDNDEGGPHTGRLTYAGGYADRPAAADTDVAAAFAGSVAISLVMI